MKVYFPLKKATIFLNEPSIYVSNLILTKSTTEIANYICYILAKILSHRKLCFFLLENVLFFLIRKLMSNFFMEICKENQLLGEKKKIFTDVSLAKYLVGKVSYV